MSAPTSRYNDGGQEWEEDASGERVLGSHFPIQKTDSCFCLLYLSSLLQSAFGGACILCKGSIVMFHATTGQSFGSPVHLCVPYGGILRLFLPLWHGR